MITVSEMRVSIQMIIIMGIGMMVRFGLMKIKMEFLMQLSPMKILMVMGSGMGLSPKKTL